MLDRRRQLPRPVDQPKPGYYLVKLVKGGPSVPAEIRCEDGVWSASVNGRPCGRSHTDPLRAAGVDKIYLGLQIDRAQYERRLKLKDIPGHPNATPYLAIDLAKLPPIRF